MFTEYRTLTKGIKIYELRFKVESNDNPTFYQNVKIGYKTYDKVILDDLLKKGFDIIRQRNPYIDITKIEYIDGTVHFE